MPAGDQILPGVERYVDSPVPFTASAARAKGDAVKEGNRYGIVHAAVANTAKGTLHIRGVWEITKETATDTWADGADLEAVLSGATMTVQAHTAGGTRIGKAWGATTNGATTAKVQLMPELNTDSIPAG